MDWDDARVLARMRRDVLRTLADPDAVWNSEETGFPKKGVRSVGVKRQYSGILGCTVDYRNFGGESRTVRGRQVRLTCVRQRT
jgi:SRSO17 transposase